jgi:hypothetical protein
MSRSNPSSLAREENERQAVALDEETHAAGKDSPLLLEEEREQAAKSKLVGARVIHEVLREEGHVELRRPVAHDFAADRKED